MRNSKPDPIFALIEAHREAIAAYAASLTRYNALERRFGSAPELDKPRRPEVTKWEKENEQADAGRDRALRDLCRTKPTTLAGISAVTLYLVEAWHLGRRRLGSNPDYYADPPNGDFLQRLLLTLAASAETIAKRSTSAQRGKVLPFRKAA